MHSLLLSTSHPSQLSVRFLDIGDFLDHYIVSIMQDAVKRRMDKVQLRLGTPSTALGTPVVISLVR